MIEGPSHESGRHGERAQTTNHSRAAAVGNGVHVYSHDTCRFHARMTLLVFRPVCGGGTLVPDLSAGKLSRATAPPLK